MNNSLRRLLIASIVMAAPAAMGHGTERPGLDTLDVSDPGQVFELTDQPVPGLAVNARRAADGGWNFEVTLTNFGIMEGDAPAEALGNSGHVHMFVKGTSKNSRFDRG